MGISVGHAQERTKRPNDQTTKRPNDPSCSPLTFIESVPTTSSDPGVRVLGYGPRANLRCHRGPTKPPHGCEPVTSFWCSRQVHPSSYAHNTIALASAVTPRARYMYQQKRKEATVRTRPIRVRWMADRRSRVSREGMLDLEIPLLVGVGFVSWSPLMATMTTAMLV
jgi:hypothetical protein